LFRLFLVPTLSFQATFRPPPQKIIKIGIPARPPLDRTPPAQRRPNFDDFLGGRSRNGLKKKKKVGTKKKFQKNGSGKNGSEKKV